LSRVLLSAELKSRYGLTIHMDIIWTVFTGFILICFKAFLMKQVRDIEFLLGLSLWILAYRWMLRFWQLRPLVRFSEFLGGFSEPGAWHHPRWDSASWAASIQIWPYEQASPSAQRVWACSFVFSTSRPSSFDILHNLRLSLSQTIQLAVPSGLVLLTLSAAGSGARGNISCQAFGLWHHVQCKLILSLWFNFAEVFFVGQRGFWLRIRIDFCDLL